MKKVSEQRMKLRIEYSRETDLIFSDNIPAYADWLEKKLALSQHDVSGSAEFKAWDDLFGILAWKFKPTKSGDMYLDGEAVYNELKEKFDLRRK